MLALSDVVLLVYIMIEKFLKRIIISAFISVLDNGQFSLFQFDIYSFSRLPLNKYLVTNYIYRYFQFEMSNIFSNHAIFRILSNI